MTIAQHRTAPPVIVVSGGRATGHTDLPGPLDGPILVGIVGPADADRVLRRALDEAEQHGLPVRVLAVGRASEAAEAALADQVARWSEKHPEVPVSFAASRVLDAAVTLAAASGNAGLLVVEDAGGPVMPALVRAIRRRARCPVMVLARAVRDGRQQHCAIEAT